MDLLKKILGIILAAISSLVIGMMLLMIVVVLVTGDSMEYGMVFGVLIGAVVISFISKKMLDAGVYKKTNIRTLVISGLLILSAYIYSEYFDGKGGSSSGMVENYSFRETKNYVKNSGIIVLDSKKVKNYNGTRYEYYFIVKLGSDYCLQVFKSDASSLQMDDQYCGTYNFVKGEFDSL